MTYFLRSNPATDRNLRVHVWSGNEFLPRDIRIAQILKFSDNDVSSGAELDPLVEAMIETAEGALFVRESLEHLCARLYAYLFNPPPLHSFGHHSSAYLSNAELRLSHVRDREG